MKSWREKRDTDKVYQIKLIEKRFADIQPGSRMLIATPKIIDNYIKNIAVGDHVDLSTLRNDLAEQFDADKTCPVTTGIYLRIVSEAAFEEFLQDCDVNAVTPFWRIVDVNSALAKKLACGLDFLREQQKREGIL